MIIYYNARCSKCREALDLLNKNKCEVTFREYLKEPPTKKELSTLLKMLGCKAEDLVRKTEHVYKEKFASKSLTQTQWLSALIKYPVLIQRPIVVDGHKAVIGRPAELVLDLLK